MEKGAGEGGEVVHVLLTPTSRDPAIAPHHASSSHFRSALLSALSAPCPLQIVTMLDIFKNKK